MGIQSRLDGVAQASDLFDRLPEAAQAELIVDIALIGREISTAQRADVPKITHLLESSLTIAVGASGLRVKVGLLSGKYRKTINAFYGRFVEFGRKAQTVLVTRHLRRTVKGNGRYGNKRRVTFAGKPYTLHVKARKAHPFVEQPLLEEVGDLYLADFWSKALTRADGAA